MGWYLPLKYLHVGCAIASIGLFVLRGAWKTWSPAMLLRRWVRILPHVIDTVFLAAGIALAALLHQYPFVNGWLTAKVFGLIAYIILGSIALKRASGVAFGASFFAAVAVFVYIARVAVTHDAMAGLGR